MKKRILFSLLPVLLLALQLLPGCRSARELCREEARVRCFGESLENKPQRFIGGEPVGCKVAVFDSCLNRRQAD